MRGRSRVREARGSALTLVGFGLVACLLATGALVANLRSLFQGRVDAEHAAEAAALAGASAYLNCTARSVVDSAKQRALRSAGQRYVFGVLIDTSTVQTEATLHRAAEVMVEVIPDEYKVRVRVQRNASGLLEPLNSFLGILRAEATAQAAPGDAICVQPLAEPDHRGWRWLVEE